MSDQLISALGPPGSGKTLLARMMVCALAKESLAALAVQRQGVHDVPIPIYVPLAAVAEQGSLPAAVAATIRTLLDDQDEPLVAAVSQHVQAALCTDRCWLFLDALDEVPAGVALQAAFASLRHAACRLVVTSQPDSAIQAPLPWRDLAVYELAPFSPAQRQEFVATWFHDDDTRRKQLQAVFEEDPQCDELTRNALDLTLSCAHAEHHGGFTQTSLCFVAILCRLCRNSLPQYPHDPGEFPFSTKNSSFID